MLKPKVLVTVFTVLIISVSAIIFFQLTRKPYPGPTTRPDRGLGYSPPGEYTPGAGIHNSPHDLSANSGYSRANRYNPEGETNTCIFCHNKSSADFNMADSSNWNHAPSEVVAFTPYSNGGLQPNDPNHRLSADVSQGPGPVSKFCLSCHDGTMAINRYGSLTGNVHISDSYKVGVNGVLSNHHPIGFVYAAVMDDEINQYAVLGGHPIEELLSNGRMECTTCHDVHNKGNSGEKLLWVSDRNSGLCCSCHKKCSK